MIAEKLGELLVTDGLITEEELAQAIHLQQTSCQSLGETLIELGCAAPEDVASSLSKQFDIPYFELGEDFRLDPEEVKLIPEAIARRYCLLPVHKNEDDVVTVIMKDPLDLDAVDTVRSVTGMEVRKAVSTEERILAVIGKFYTEEAHIERNLKDLIDLEELTSGINADGEVDPNQLLMLANDAPVVRFVNLLLMQAVRDRASDIHFEPGETDVTIRLRVDGVLREVTPPPKHLYQAIVTRIKILAEMDIAEHRLPLDGRFKFNILDHAIDIRVSSLPEVHGEKLVLRVLDQSTLLVDMTDIGFEEDTLARFQQTLKTPHGIILLTGPTGSGKTTTLYSALSYLKSPERNIQTVEDPVEYMVAGVNQMSIKEKIGLDFANSLRSILRQDPDIIMIGEMRDLETSRIAIRASLTGHLVLSTLHTNDATSAFSRLRDIGIAPFLIAATVKLVISQRLVRKVCDACRQPALLSPEELAVVTSKCPEARGWTFYQGAGCQACNYTGYRGRTAVMEFLDMSDPIRNLILEEAGDVPVRQTAMDLGMESLTENGLLKVKRGITSMPELLRVWPVMEYAERMDTEDGRVQLYSQR